MQKRKNREIEKLTKNRNREIVKSKIEKQRNRKIQKYKDKKCKVEI